MTTTTTQLTDLSAQALHQMAYNKPLHKDITKRTLNALVKRGLATFDGSCYWITQSGRETIGISLEASSPRARKPRAKKPIEVKHCLCCAAPTKGGNFLPGHDARLIARLATQIDSQELSLTAAVKQLDGLPRLQNKLQSRFVQ